MLMRFQKKNLRRQWQIKNVIIRLPKHILNKFAKYHWKINAKITKPHMQALKRKLSLKLQNSQTQIWTKLFVKIKRWKPLGNMIYQYSLMKRKRKKSHFIYTRQTKF